MVQRELREIRIEWVSATFPFGNAFWRACRVDSSVDGKVSSSNWLLSECKASCCRNRVLLRKLTLQSVHLYLRSKMKNVNCLNIVHNIICNICIVYLLLRQEPFVLWFWKADLLTKLIPQHFSNLVDGLCILVVWIFKLNGYFVLNGQSEHLNRLLFTEPLNGRVLDVMDSVFSSSCSSIFWYWFTSLREGAKSQ